MIDNCLGDEDVVGQRTFVKALSMMFLCFHLNPES